MATDTAVLLLAWRRPETTRRVLDAIRIAAPRRLYVACDGPRPGNAADARDVAATRALIEGGIDWPCTVSHRYSEHNQGCRVGVGSAIGWFFDHEPEGIVLEDDTLPDPSFFPFCTELLARYRDDPRVMCVTGDNFQPPTRRYEADYYFSIYNHCWGWASWRRAWALFDAELHGFQDDVATRSRLDRLQSAPGFADFWIYNLAAVRDRRLDTWDFAWTWSCWANGGLTATPRVNLVSNIGFGPDATHTTGSDAAEALLATRPLSFPLRHPERVEVATACDAHVTQASFGIPRATFLQRAWRRLGRWSAGRWSADASRPAGSQRASS